MSFNSLNFWFVFPFIFFIYWAIPSRCVKLRNLFLLFVSYLLYSIWKPAFAFVLFGVTSVCFLGGCAIESRSSSDKKKQLCVVFAFLGLLPLLFFKYYGFLNDSVSIGLEHIGLHFLLPGLNWAIPVGISFYTFQAVGYVLDVYHNRIKAERNFLDFALFVSFFPQVVSGPVSTAQDLMSQIIKSHSFNYDQAVTGLKMILWGIFLKCVVADRLGIYVDIVYDHYERFSGANCLMASIFFSFQIYADFAGYSLMAIGLAKTLGFDLVNNFNRPYLATGIGDFWRRWNISITRWLTTHVYINMGGNRCGKIRQYLNIMTTFLVSGLWHGAGWTFVIWGCIHGIFLIVEKASGLAPKGKYHLTLDQKRWTIPFRIAITFLFVNFAWIFFRMPSIADAVELINRILTNADGLTQSVPHKLIMTLIFIMLAISEISEEYLRGRFNLFSNRSKIVRWICYVVTFVLVLLYGVLDSSSFIYASF